MTELEPLVQGDLDEWSGIYAVLNSIRWLNPDVELDIFGTMFTESLARITENRRGKRSARVTYGLFVDEVEALLGVLLDEYDMGFRSLVDDTTVSEWTLASYWRALSNFMERANGRGVILLNVRGMRHHWSVVTSISNESMCLFDSQYLDELERTECTVSDSMGARFYHLSVYESFLVYKRD